MITNSMKEGVVRYGDTFIDGSVYRQRAIERKLLEALRHYSGTDNQEFLKGLMLANEIVSGAIKSFEDFNGRPQTQLVRPKLV